MTSTQSIVARESDLACGSSPTRMFCVGPLSYLSSNISPSCIFGHSSCSGTSRMLKQTRDILHRNLVAGIVVAGLRVEPQAIFDLARRRLRAGAYGHARGKARGSRCHHIEQRSPFLCRRVAFRSSIRKGALLGNSSRSLCIRAQCSSCDVR